MRTVYSPISHIAGLSKGPYKNARDRVKVGATETPFPCVIHVWRLAGTRQRGWSWWFVCVISACRRIIDSVMSTGLRLQFNHNICIRFSKYSARNHDTIYDMTDHWNWNRPTAILFHLLALSGGSRGGRGAMPPNRNGACCVAGESESKKLWASGVLPPDPLITLGQSHQTL